MAITKLNSLAIPAGTVEPADISYPLTNFSSTGIDDNASSTAMTIYSSGIEVSGSFSSTVTGYDSNGNTLTNIGTTISGVKDGSVSNNVLPADLIFSTNGGSASVTERMRINSSGNVGIGTSSTSAIRLNVTTPTANHIAAQIENSNTSDGFGLIVKAGNDGNDYSADFRKRDNTNLMRIRGDGNVGIGTTSPATKLQVNGQARITDGTTNIDSISAGGVGYFGTQTDHSLAIRTNDVERMRVTTAGTVGIGITSPAAVLHVNGTGDLIRCTSTNSSSGGAQIDLMHFSASPADDDLHGMINFGGYYSGTSQAYGSAIRSAWSDVSARQANLRFYTRNGSTFGERMRIDSNGYVTKPSTPAFSYGAYTTYDVSGTGTQTVSTSTVWNNSSYVHLNYNNGSHFNASNGRFTAPVAGIYRFDYRCGVADHNSGYFWWYIYKNSTAIAYWQSTQGKSSGSDDVALASLHVYVNLAANDYIEVKWANNYVSGTVYYPHFSGALVA